MSLPKPHYTYLITHKETNMKYIGVRTSKNDDLLDDLKKYKTSTKRESFKEELRDHPQNFGYIILDRFETRKEAVQLEIDLHDFHDVAVNPKFYNDAKQTSTGFDRTGVTGWKHSDEAKEKMRIASLGNCYCLGYKHTEEAKEGMGKYRLNIPLTPEHKDKIRIKIIGRKHTEEAKRNMSVAQKGRAYSAEQREVLSESTRKVPVEIEGKLFDSIKKAAVFYKVSPKCIDGRLDNVKFPEYIRLGEKRSKKPITIRKPRANLILVQIDDKVYESMKEAARAMGTSATAINNRCKSKNFKNYIRL